MNLFSVIYQNKYSVCDKICVSKNNGETCDKLLTETD